MSAQAQSTRQSDNPASASASASGNAQQRTINWDAASRDAISSDTSQKVVVLNARTPGTGTRGASTEQSELLVPVLLPVSNRAMQLNSGQTIEFDEPRLLQTNNGYTSVLKSSVRDLIIDASNKSLVSGATAMQVPTSNFDGDYQQTEGGGGEVTIGRYGALYSIQLVCNNPERADCVNEDMLRSIIDGLVLTQPLYRTP